MKLKRFFTSVCLCLSLILLSMISPITAHATVTGDNKSDPIILEQKQTRNTSFTKDGNVKYFRLVVKETGNATISFTSTKLKKNATMTLFYDEGGVYSDQVTIKYNKSTKKAVGKLTTSKMLAPGQYNVVVQTSTVSKNTAFTVSTSFKAYSSDDVEPNNKEENAQAMTVKAAKSAVTYKMLLSGDTLDEDVIDYFTFKVKSEKKIKITAKTSSSSSIRVLLKRKTATGSEIVNAKESEQYFISKNGTSTFTYTDTLSKGTYYVMVWLQDTDKTQIKYSISAASL